MKNLISFLIYCLSFTAIWAQTESHSSLTILSKNKQETVIKMALTGIEQETVETPMGAAQIISIGDGTPILRSGAPDLPKLATSLLIPDKGSMAIEILDSEYTELDAVEIAPSKGNLKRNVDPATVPYKYGAAYDTDGFFPGNLADLTSPFIFRQTRGQSLWIYPVQYNPVTKRLRVYSSITVKVYQTDAPGENELKPNPAVPTSRAFEQLYRKLYLNYDQSYYHRNNTDIEKMLIICQDNYLDEIEPLVIWKRQRGIATDVVPTSAIGADAASVYSFVTDYYNNNGITYLLLVGDETSINPEMRPSGGGSYSCDNCFGYMEGDDHFSEILVGRFNAATEAQVNIMVQRNLEYEKNPLVDTSAEWCSAALGAGSNQGAGIGDDNQADWQQLNDWKTQHLADGYTKIWEFYDGNHTADSPTGDDTADQPGDPINSNIVQLLNSHGAGLYNYCGHGWEQGLVSGNFNTDAVALLRNVHRYPILIAVACCAGNFTNNSGGDCLGEAIQRAGNTAINEVYGSIGGFFSSDFQSWAPPMEGQDGMNQVLLDADGVTLVPTIGSMLAYGNAVMIASYAGGGETMADFWNPFADPTTVPRTRQPQPLTATHTPTLFLGETSIAVSCPVEGALVAIYWQGQPIGTAIVTGGSATVTFPGLSNVGDLLVTITQFNYIPYQNTVSVVPQSGPFVVNQSVTLDDSAGNNNQKADYSETIALNVALKNVGISEASGITAALSTADGAVTIMDADEAFDNLAPDAVQLKNGAFTFGVASDVPDQHIVNFNIHVNFGGTQSSDFSYPVQINAPKLAVGTITIDDSAGGNGNGRFDSGETALVTIQTSNIGHSASTAAVGTLTTDSPYLQISGPAALGIMDASGAVVGAQFTVLVAAGAPVSAIANFQYTAAAGAYTAEKAFDGLLINATIEDYESGLFTQFPWYMTSTPWQVTNQIAYEGEYCSRSGNISNNNKSVMNLQVNILENGQIAFARKVSSENGYDFLTFSIDNLALGEWSGEQDWEVVSYAVTPGIHTFTWKYEKDEIVADGQDRAWVDNVILPPFEVITAVKDIETGLSEVTIYPNPTNRDAVVSYTLEGTQSLAITLKDCLGRTVHTAFNGVQSAGSHSVALPMAALSDGLYFVCIAGDNGQKVLKLVKGR